MKKIFFISLLVGTFIFSPMKSLANDEAATEVSNDVIQLDPSQFTKSTNRLRSGEQELEVDIDKWENEIEKKYKNENPEFDGELKIVHYDDYEQDKDWDEYEDKSLEELIEQSEESSGPMTRGAATTGAHIQHDSVGKAYLFFDGGGGRLVMAEGSGFKVSNTKVGTAGHAVYNKDKGLGWAKMATINFAFRNDPRVGWVAKSIYSASRFKTNNDYIGAPNFLTAFRSDFGSMTVSRSSGIVPPNVSMRNSAPKAINNVSAFGFRSGNRYLTKSTQNVKTSSIRSDWFDWVYQAELGVTYSGMSGGPLFDGSGSVIGIYVGRVYPKNVTHSVFTKMNQAAYNNIINP